MVPRLKLFLFLPKPFAGRYRDPTSLSPSEWDSVAVLRKAGEFVIAPTVPGTNLLLPRGRLAETFFDAASLSPLTRAVEFAIADGALMANVLALSDLPDVRDWAPGETPSLGERFPTVPWKEGLCPGDLLGVVVAPVSDESMSLSEDLAVTVVGLGGQRSSDLVLEGWIIEADGPVDSVSRRSSGQSRCLTLFFLRTISMPRL